MTATSLDGRYRADVAPVRPVACGPDGTGATLNAAHTLNVKDVRTGRSVGGYMGGAFDKDRAHDTTVFGNPRFSPDGERVYFVARATLCELGTWRDAPKVYWVDSGSITRRPATFVATGRLIAIVRDGPRKGALLIQQRAAAGGRGDPVVLYSPAGKRLLTVPGSDRSGLAALRPWLRQRGWRTC